MNNILEHKSNFLIIKEYNFIKLYSFKSLVCIYNTDSRTFEDVPYTFKDVYGASCSYSVTTTRHIIKFKNYVLNRSLKNE